MGHLVAHDVTVVAGDRVLLDALTFSASPGELVAVVGPNGVGKTTLLRTLAGVAVPKEGTVELDGVPVRRMPAAARARVLTLLSSDGGDVEGLTVREAAIIGRYAHHAWWDWRRDDSDVAAVDAALARVSLTEFADRELSTLSSGERARLWLAFALAGGAATLLLDEPTSHLDVRFAHEILGLLRDFARDGSSVVAVLHDLNEAAAFADRVALIAPGRLLAFDVPRSALTAPLLSQAFGIGFDVLETPSGYRVLTAWTSPPTRAYPAPDARRSREPNRNGL